MEEMAEVSARQQATPSPSTGIPVFQQPGDAEDPTATMVRSAKARRRASLSISRFGQVSRNWPLLIHDASAQQLPSRSQRTPSISLSVRVAFLERRPLSPRSLSNPHYMLSLR